MGLSRRGSSSRGEAPIWPGFVDAMTSLLMVLIFVLTIFMIVQFVLRETITTQDSQLTQLNTQLSGLADALGLEKKKTAALTGDLNDARKKADEQASLIATLSGQLQQKTSDLQAAQGKITDFQARVASLLADQASARKANEALTSKVSALQTKRDALQVALADLKQQVSDKETSLTALAAQLSDQKDKAKATADQLAKAQSALTEAQKEKLAEQAAAKILQDKLKNSQDELTAMTLQLEAQRKKAEDTLTLLAAAKAAETQAKDKQQAQLTEAQKQAALLAVANDALSKEKATSAEGQRKVALLNQQVAALRSQLQSLQGMLDDSQAKDSKNKVQIQALGSQLNAALAQVAMETKKRLAAEEAARKAAEEKAQNLEQYRSEFFGKLRQVLKDQPGVRIVGDRFVFSSEVLFEPGSATLSPEGKTQIANVTQTLKTIAAEIPSSINWILEVDGFTDKTPLTGNGQFTDNWQLSQARALSVVHYMIDALGFPPDHLAAAGFGEYQPVATSDSPDARAQNRRIEMKLTER